MRHKTFVILRSFLFFCCLFIFCAYAQAENNKLEYLKNNFNNVYMSNYDQFWKVLHDAQKKAESCESAEDTIAFLKLVEIRTGNAEFNAYFNEVIEKLCVEKPKCFFDALANLNENAIIRTVALLKAPLFVDTGDIDVVFKKDENVKKYTVIMSEYFRGK